MTGASIETTLELWASSLRDVKGRMRGLFTQERVAASANLFLDGLLGDERRKTGWMRAEAAGIRDHGGNRLLWVEGDGTQTRFVILCETMLLRALRRTMRCWSSTRPDFSSKATPLVASRVNIPDQPARSRTARLVYSRPMYQLAVTRLSIGLCICRRAGWAIPRASPQPMFLKL